MTRGAWAWLAATAAAWLIADYSLHRFVGHVLDARRPLLDDDLSLTDPVSGVTVEGEELAC